MHLEVDDETLEDGVAQHAAHDDHRRHQCDGSPPSAAASLLPATPVSHALYAAYIDKAQIDKAKSEVTNFVVLPVAQSLDETLTVSHLQIEGLAVR